MSTLAAWPIEYQTFAVYIPLPTQPSGSVDGSPATLFSFEASISKKSKVKIGNRCDDLIIHIASPGSRSAPWRFQACGSVVFRDNCISASL